MNQRARCPVSISRMILIRAAQMSHRVVRAETRGSIIEKSSRVAVQSPPAGWCGQVGKIPDPLAIPRGGLGGGNPLLHETAPNSGGAALASRPPPVRSVRLLIGGAVHRTPRPHFLTFPEKSTPCPRYFLLLRQIDKIADSPQAFWCWRG